MPNRPQPLLPATAHARRAQPSSTSHTPNPPLEQSCYGGRITTRIDSWLAACYCSRGQASVPVRGEHSLLSPPPLLHFHRRNQGHRERLAHEDGNPKGLQYIFTLSKEDREVTAPASAQCRLPTTVNEGKQQPPGRKEQHRTVSCLRGPSANLFRLSLACPDARRRAPLNTQG
jgi:hypothetical protein